MSSQGLEYVAGIVSRLDDLSRFISDTTPQVVAEEFLASTLIDYPRPPWWTGELRNSGAVYIGTQLYMTTRDVAARRGADYLLEENPAIYGKSGKRSKRKGLTGHRLASMDELSPQKISGTTFRGSGSPGSFGEFTSLRNKITVVYSSPIAATMHEWEGKFSDPDSGKYFVSSKAFMASANAALRLKKIYRSAKADRFSGGSFTGGYMDDFLDM